jgi:hypothetical protein
MARATTTPAIRARIAASEELAAVLAGRYGVTLDTIYRWRGRTSFEGSVANFFLITHEPQPV